MRSLAVFLSLSLIAALASCGDDDSAGDSSSSASLSHAEFVREAEKICVRESDKATARYGSYVKQHEDDGKSESDLQGEAIKLIFLPSVEDQIDQIGSLSTPEGDEKQVEGFLTALEDAVDESREAPLTPRAEAAFRKVNSVGRAYGLERCAYG